MNRTLLLIITLLVALSTIEARTRTQFTLQKGWKFTREDNPRSSEIEYDDSEW